MRILYLFTNDLRLQDNIGLQQAVESGYVLPLYILDKNATHTVQGAAAWWLHKSLTQLKHSLKEIGLPLILRSGNVADEIDNICTTLRIDAVYSSRVYTPEARAQQKNIHQQCEKKGILFKRFPGTLLFEPEAIQNKQGDFYKVFTPFYKHCIKQFIRKPLPFIKMSPKPLDDETHSELLDDWHLIPSSPNWAIHFESEWQPGEQHAHHQVKEAIEGVVNNYAKTRNEVSLLGTSKLSPYLRFGELSPAQIWHDITTHMPYEEAEAYLRQIIWREFNQHLLFHRPDMLNKSFKKTFDHFPWQNNNALLHAWQQGQTGYPIVDAAMQELWQTGWMHNRARMIVASFLTKHLLTHWQHGANWFWDTLVDADLANNINGWQWTAGCGADAAPYFRIFNPITQDERFDAKGEYTKKWLPTLAKLPTKYLFSPWTAPAEILNDAGITLGKDYPHPIVEHKEAREIALNAYSSMKASIDATT